jgi:hypothetical protein
VPNFSTEKIAIIGNQIIIVRRQRQDFYLGFGGIYWQSRFGGLARNPLIIQFFTIVGFGSESIWFLSLSFQMMNFPIFGCQVVEMEESLKKTFLTTMHYVGLCTQSIIGSTKSLPILILPTNSNEGNSQHTPLLRHFLFIHHLESNPRSSWQGPRHQGSML